MDVDLSVPILLDGATATNLFENLVPQDVCVEQWILEHPQKLIDLQKQYAAIGSQILYAPTFGASTPRLEKFGLADEMERINRELVALTRSVADNVLVAGVLSPTGLTLEPFGETSFTEMIHVYREQAAVLVEAGVDLLVVETLTSIGEARAAAIALAKFDLPKIITLTVDKDGETPYGGTAVNALIILQELGISAFGLNCSCGPELMAEVLESLKPYAKIPLVAKPSACRYDEDTERLLPITPIEMAVQMKRLLAAGATIVGGCCGTTPDHLEAIRDAMEEHEFTPFVPAEGEGDITLADIRQIYNLYCDQIECTEPLACSVDMTDELLELEGESVDVIVVEINTIDDAKDWALNAHMANLPVCFYSHDEISLRLALLLYNGRAMIDSRSSLEEEKLQKIAEKYGAVIY